MNFVAIDFVEMWIMLVPKTLLTSLWACPGKQEDVRIMSQRTHLSTLYSKGAQVAAESVRKSSWPSQTKMSQVIQSNPCSVRFLFVCLFAFVCLFVCLCFLNVANQGIRLEGKLFKPSSKSYDCGISVCVYQFSDSKNCFCLVYWKQSSHTSAGATHLGLFRSLAKSIIMELDQKRNTWQYYNPQLHSLPPVLATGSFKFQVTGMFMNCLMCFFLCIYNIICMFISTL